MPPHLCCNTLHAAVLLYHRSHVSRVPYLYCKHTHTHTHTHTTATGALKRCPVAEKNVGANKNRGRTDTLAVHVRHAGGNVTHDHEHALKVDATLGRTQMPALDEVGKGATRAELLHSPHVFEKAQTDTIT